jgi:hypothetical protein
MEAKLYKIFRGPIAVSVVYKPPIFQRPTQSPSSGNRDLRRFRDPLSFHPQGKVISGLSETHSVSILREK